MRYRNGLVEAITLWLSLSAAEWFCPGKAIPLLAKLGAVVCLAMAPHEKGAEGQGPWARWVARLPVYGGVAAVIGVALYFWIAPPLGFYGFLPLWAAIMAAWCFRGWFGPFARAAAGIAASRRLDVVAGCALIVGLFHFLGSCFLPGQEFGRGHLVVYLCMVATLAAYLACLATLRRRGVSPIAENMRWMTLIGAWVLLLHPFMQVELHGSSDAAWYGNNLADMLAQVRHGVFLVFVGRSVYQFNGAISPLRVAPAFHYLGALVDTLTLRTLGVYAVQNLTISVLGLAALFTCYLSLAAVAPKQRWFACALSLLFVSCPGVLGLVFNTDLFMSWTTVPFLPIAFYGMVRSFSRADMTSMLLIGGGLGVVWWGHTPVAMWATMFIGASQVVRVLVRRPDAAGWRGLSACALVFVLIAAYPVVSVLGFPPSSGERASNPQMASAGVVIDFLKEVFPSVLLPLSPNGRQLSDFQLGYALWAVLGLCLWRIARVPAFEFRVLVGIALAVVLLVTPIPGVLDILWRLVPVVVRDATGNWAMSRLYVVMACALVYAGAVACARIPDQAPAARRALGVLAALLCGWSLMEAGKFASGSAEFQRPRESAQQMLLPENVSLTRYSYLFFPVFPKHPAYFSHGVVDPGLENRLLSPATDLVVDSDVDAIVRAVAAGDPSVRRVMETQIEADPAAPEGAPPRARDAIVLKPARKYLVGFDFLRQGDEPGVLQFRGVSLYREYLLPAYGGTASFGRGGAHSKWVPLWTSGAAEEPVTVRFVPSSAHLSPDRLLPFARMQVIEYDPATLPIRVESWIPYRATVEATQPSWLETPRMYQPWYVARVNGGRAEIRSSPEGLVSIAVPLGRSRVELDFAAPLLLQAAFWLSLLSASGLAGWGFFRALSRVFAPANG